MDADLDPFGDVLDEPAAARARPAGKFQPKAGPRKGKAAAVAPPSDHAAAASKATEMTTDGGGGGGGDAALGDLDSSSGKVAAEGTETADMFMELDAMHGLVSQPTNDAGLSSVPCGNEGLDRDPRSSSLVQESVDSSEFRSGVATKDHVAADTDGERLQSEASGDFPDLEKTNVFSEYAVAAEIGKGKPHDDGILPDGVESLVPSEGTYFIASGTRYGSESSLSAAQGDAVVYYSSMNFDDFLPSEPAASEFPTNSEQTDLKQACVLNEGDKSDALRFVPDLVENEGQESREKSGLESELTQKTTNSSLTNGRNGGRLLRKRSGTIQAVNQPENEGYVDGSSLDEENDSDYDVGEDGDNDTGGDDDSDGGGEGTSKKKRASKRSKKSVPDKETGRRKRKKGSKTSAQSIQEPPKKFAHTTHRKKRYRNNELLKVPENEIDFRSLSMRDIIFLGEHRERLAAKEAKAAKTPSTDQGPSTSHNEVDAIEPVEAGNISDTPLFNSHSFMNRTRTMRWSKQETELFYEGIRQFGTDLSLVQQLFPERDRRQIKNKFKAEERRQPFLLFEALGNRDRDISYFERVISQLQNAAAEAGRELKRDQPTDEAEEVDELNPETNEEAGNSEQDPEETIAEPLSSGKLEEEIVEDEDDIWSSYQSEF